MFAKTIQYAYKPLGESVYQESTSDKWDTPWYSVYVKSDTPHVVYVERVLHNYFIPNHRKYVGQLNQWDIHLVHDGKVG